MEIKKIDFDFSVCKVEDYSQVDLEQKFCFIGKTDEEKSLVCLTENVPQNTVERDDGWKAFRIQGVLDLMAEKGIGIFTISTYNTDYILTKTKNYNKAIKALSDEGYRID